jgi:hypothetical protein
VKKRFSLVAPTRATRPHGACCYDSLFPSLSLSLSLSIHTYAYTHTNTTHTHTPDTHTHTHTVQTHTHTQQRHTHTECPLLFLAPASATACSANAAFFFPSFIWILFWGAFFGGGGAVLLPLRKVEGAGVMSWRAGACSAPCCLSEHAAFSFCYSFPGALLLATPPCCSAEHAAFRGFFL